ncbi:MAG: LPS export ABC transporter periplasmic protein LptC [Bryobacteraceae bacterium]|jgi:lipopolysaccharide export system protein LptA
MRWVLLVAIVAMVGGVAVTYRASKKALKAQAPEKPRELPSELRSAAPKYHFEDNSQGHLNYDLEAEDFRELKDSSRTDLSNVQLRLFNKEGDAYDLVKSGAASFFANEHRFFSDGDVEITLNVPVKGEAKHQLITVRSSGVTCDTDTHTVDTNRPTTFVFEHGTGQSAGASYDPNSRVLVMKSQVQLDWNPAHPGAKPMKIEAASLIYPETKSEIWLKPWGRLTRGDTVVEGQEDVVRIHEVTEADGKKRTVIHQVEAVKARGTDTYPDRSVQYSADWVLADFDDEGVTRKITGRNGAQLTSTSPTTTTEVKAGAVDMDFASRNDESVLERVSATDNAVVTSRPLPAPGRQLTETHVLRSQVVEVKMREGGRDMETVVTHAPGTLEFLPNLPAQHHRTLDGNDMVIAYAPQNRIQSFHTTNARTRTDPTDEEKRRNQVASFTASRELAARFDPKTSKMSSMEQTGAFTYEEGDRRARAAKATLDSDQNVILLETSARVWDSTGSTTADRIRLDQSSGDFVAEGNVYSSRLPDADQKKSSDMLSGDDPLQAQARKMDSRRTDPSARTRKIHYEGNAVMWQGANRIQADTIDVDHGTLVANGNVVSNLWEQPSDQPADSAQKPAPSGQPASSGQKPAPAGSPQKPAPSGQPLSPGQKPASANPVLTVVHAQHLVYTDENRLAVYTGGVTLKRTGLDVKSQELRAYMAEAGASSRLEKALADGAVEIVQTANRRTRTGTGGHAEYYTANQKVVMHAEKGGKAKLVDTVSGTSEGLELTYFANDDRLLGSGAPTEPVNTRIVRKK